MGIKMWLGMAAAAIGGIYLTSEEGKKAREALQKKKSMFEPIIKDLLKDANQVLEGSKEFNSKEVRANIELLVNEAKNTLVDIDLEKAIDTIKDAIKVASNKINEASNETKKVAVKKAKRSTSRTKEVKLPSKTTKTALPKKDTSKTKEVKLPSKTTKTALPKKAASKTKEVKLPTKKSNTTKTTKANK